MCVVKYVEMVKYLQVNVTMAIQTMETVVLTFVRSNKDINAHSLAVVLQFVSLLVISSKFNLLV